MMAMLDEHVDGSTEPAIRLARRAAFRTLARDLLQPGTDLGRAAAAAQEAVVGTRG
jgi:hypothetical protein